MRVLRTLVTSSVHTLGLWGSIISHMAILVDARAEVSEWESVQPHSIQFSMISEPERDIHITYQQYQVCVSDLFQCGVHIITSLMLKI